MPIKQAVAIAESKARGDGKNLSGSPPFKTKGDGVNKITPSGGTKKK